jgi:hypothetical protein
VHVKEEDVDVVVEGAEAEVVERVEVVEAEVETVEEKDDQRHQLAEIQPKVIKKRNH